MKKYTLALSILAISSSFVAYGQDSLGTTKATSPTSTFSTPRVGPRTTLYTGLLKSRGYLEFELSALTWSERKETTTRKTEGTDATDEEEKKETGFASGVPTIQFSAVYGDFKTALKLLDRSRLNAGTLMQGYRFAPWAEAGLTVSMSNTESISTREEPSKQTETTKDSLLALGGYGKFTLFADKPYMIELQGLVGYGLAETTNETKQDNSGTVTTTSENAKGGGLAYGAGINGVINITDNFGFFMGVNYSQTKAELEGEVTVSNAVTKRTITMDIPMIDVTALGLRARF